ncbi:unnamed protein product, partial [Mesorhabditis spiculigera]
MSARVPVLLLFTCLLGFSLFNVGAAECYQCFEGSQILFKDTKDRAPDFVEGIETPGACTTANAATKKCEGDKCAHIHMVREMDGVTNVVDIRNCASKDVIKNDQWKVETVHPKGDGGEAWGMSCEGHLCNKMTLAELKVAAGGSAITALCAIITAITANALAFY